MLPWLIPLSIDASLTYFCSWLFILLYSILINDIETSKVKSSCITPPHLFGINLWASKGGLICRISHTPVFLLWRPKFSFSYGRMFEAENNPLNWMPAEAKVTLPSGLLEGVDGCDKTVNSTLGATRDACWLWKPHIPFGLLNLSKSKWGSPRAIHRLAKSTPRATWIWRSETTNALALVWSFLHPLYFSMLKLFSDPGMNSGSAPSCGRGIRKIDHFLKASELQKPFLTSKWIENLPTKHHPTSHGHLSQGQRSFTLPVANFWKFVPSFLIFWKLKLFRWFRCLVWYDVHFNSQAPKTRPNRTVHSYLNKKCPVWCDCCLNTEACANTFQCTQMCVRILFSVRQPKNHGCQAGAKVHPVLLSFVMPTGIEGDLRLCISEALAGRPSYVQLKLTLFAAIFCWIYGKLVNK